MCVGADAVTYMKSQIFRFGQVTSEPNKDIRIYKYTVTNPHFVHIIIIIIIILCEIIIVTELNIVDVVDRFI